MAGEVGTYSVEGPGTLVLELCFVFFSTLTRSWSNDAQSGGLEKYFCIHQ
jgi:hypothetical protein